MVNVYEKAKQERSGTTACPTRRSFVGHCAHNANTLDCRLRFNGAL